MKAFKVDHILIYSRNNKFQSIIVTATFWILCGNIHHMNTKSVP